MKEEKFFVDKVTEAAEISIDVKETYKRKLRSLSKLFNFGFGAKGRQFNLVRNALHYLPGVPNETSKGKLDTMVNDFVDLYKLMSYIGKGTKIEQHLMSKGINISITTPMPDQYKSLKKFQELWTDEYGVEQIPTDKKELVELMLKKSSEDLKSIETLDKEINETIMPDTCQKCEIEKKAFRQGVKLKTKKIEGKDIGDDITKMEIEAEQYSKVVDILDA